MEAHPLSFFLIWSGIKLWCICVFKLARHASILPAGQKHTVHLNMDEVDKP